jgi:hypothetical protein
MRLETNYHKKHFRFLLIAMAIICSSESALSQDSLSKIVLTEQCEEQALKHDYTEYEITGDSSITVSSRGKIDYSISSVRLEPFQYGLLFKANEKEILHCLGPFVYQDFILIEEGIDYSLFQLSEFNVTSFHIHSRVNCGTNCYSSRVDTVAIPVSNDFKPVGYLEIESKLYEYPSKWFRAYLNEEEQTLLDNVNE